MDEELISRLLEYLKNAQGFNFTGLQAAQPQYAYTGQLNTGGINSLIGNPVNQPSAQSHGFGARMVPGTNPFKERVRERINLAEQAFQGVRSNNPYINSAQDIDPYAYVQAARFSSFADGGLASLFNLYQAQQAANKQG